MTFGDILLNAFQTEIFSFVTCHVPDFKNVKRRLGHFSLLIAFDIYLFSKHSLHVIKTLKTYSVR